MKSRIGAWLLLGVAFVLVQSGAVAGTITDVTGQYTVGIGPNGELYDTSVGVGFLRNADGYDPLFPGTARDSWGVSANGVGVWADQTYLGTSGVASVSTYDPNSVSVDSLTTNGLRVLQAYAFAAPNILTIATTVWNVNSSASYVLFQRDVDWDVYPTAYFEDAFGPPISGKVVDSSYYGFETPDPTVPYGWSCAAGCFVTGDHGGGIKLSLGTLAPGASTSFVYYYGINFIGQNPASLIAQVQALGAAYYIANQSSDPDHTNSALIAVNVPEPATWTMMLIGFGTAAAGFWRRRAQPATE